MADRRTQILDLLLGGNGYEHNVFINCPFDAAYKRILDALVFVIHEAGFVARCALEVDIAAQNRFAKLSGIAADCKYGIHADFTYIVIEWLRRNTP